MPMPAERRRELLEKDRRLIWHPFTQMKDYENRDHILIEKAEGVFLYDADGNRYYDTVSSWWVNVHGHGHPRIKRAIAEQLEHMDHIIFSGLTHPPAIELAVRLVSAAPAGLTRVFYSDNGSTAVEVALKMSFQYWQHKGRKEKTKFAYLEGGYHGDTLGAVSVGGVEQYHALFKPLLFSAYALPSPYASEERSLEQTERLFRSHAREIAAFVLEPLVQAAGGMLMHSAEYVRRLRELCSDYEVHLIADEVATGFGRTGRMFACEHAGVTPDLMCLSKGLTAGVIPLAATLCTEDIYAAFYDDYETMKTFFHGHSFTGNPVACAVALASLDIFEEERVLDHVGSVAPVLQKAVRELERLPHVGNARGIGMIAAFDLLADKEAGTPFPARVRAGFRVYNEGLKEGLILRPLGDTIYFWLPLCVTVEQVRDIIARTARVLERTNFEMADP